MMTQHRASPPGQILTFAPTPVVEDTAHLLFNKNRADAEAVMAVFNWGLAEIKADGRQCQSKLA